MAPKRPGNGTTGGRAKASKHEMLVTAAAAPSKTNPDLEKGYSKYSVRLIKELLHCQATPQTESGTKAELVARAEELAQRGALPACPLCHKGVLTTGLRKKDQVMEIRCGGFSERKYKFNCAFTAEDSSMVRLPWRDIPEADLIEAANAREERLREEVEKAAAQATGMSRSLKPSADFIAALGAEACAPAAACDATLAEGKRLALSLPAEASAARQAIGAVLLQHRRDGGGFDGEAVMTALCSEYSPASTGGELEPGPAIVTANGPIADVLRDLAGHYFKEGDAMKGTSFKKGEGYIRGLTFKVETGKQVSAGRQKVPTIGKGIAAVIDEFLESGTCSKLAALTYPSENQ